MEGVFRRQNGLRKIRHLTRKVYLRFMAAFGSKVWATFSRKKVLEKEDVKGTKLNKCLKTFDLIAIGVSCTLGSGIYVLTGEVSKTQTGPAIILSFLIAAIASVLSGICYAEFATRIPKAGSAYIYTYITIGEFIAFVTGWNLALEYVIGSAVVARAFSAYVDRLTGGAIHNATQNAIGHVNMLGIANNIDFLSLALILILTILLATGVKNSSIFNNILTVLNLVVALTVVIAGLFYVKGENWKDFAPFGAHGVIAGASTCFFAFIGFDVIATTAEETKNPGTALSRSILGTVSICFLVYFSMSCVITLMVPYYKLNADTAVSDAFLQVNAVWTSHCVTVGAGISMLGCTLVSLYALPRLLYAMAQDGLLPYCFARINVRTDTPIYSTVFSGIFTGLLAMVVNLQDLVEMLSIGTLLAYTMVNMCVIKLRYQTDTEDKTPDDTEQEERIDDLEEQKRRELMRNHSRNQGRIVKICLMLLLINLFSVTSTLVFGAKWNPFLYYIIISLCGSLVIITCFVLSWQRQSERELTFKVPCVPFLPVGGLFVNICLMLELRRLTWIRLLVWMVIGMFVYFGYGMRKSVVGTQERSKEKEPLLRMNLSEKQR